MRVHGLVNQRRRSGLFLDLVSKTISSNSLPLTEQHAVHKIKASEETCSCVAQQLHPKRCLNHTEQLFLRLLHVQQVDTVLLAAVRSRDDAFKSAEIATSDTTSRLLRTPLTVTIPFPPILDYVMIWWWLNPKCRQDSEDAGLK